MNPNDVRNAMDRLQSVLSCMRKQNSGADAHTVGNIRNTATLLIEQLETDPDCMDDDLVNQMLKNIEKSVVDFYKKKYPQGAPK